MGFGAGPSALSEGNGKQSSEQGGCFPERLVQPGVFPALLRLQKSDGK